MNPDLLEKARKVADKKLTHIENPNPDFVHEVIATPVPGFPTYAISCSCGASDNMTFLEVAVESDV